MSVQITVRLPDDLVATVDQMVASGRARSRASVVERALERHIRHELALRDIEILKNTEDPDMDALAAWGAHLPLDTLD